MKQLKKLKIDEAIAISTLDWLRIKGNIGIVKGIKKPTFWTETLSKSWSGMSVSAKDRDIGLVDSISDDLVAHGFKATKGLARAALKDYVFHKYYGVNDFLINRIVNRVYVLTTGSNEEQGDTGVRVVYPIVNQVAGWSLKAFALYSVEVLKANSFDEDVVKIGELYADGLKNTVIAEKLGIDDMDVTRALQLIESRGINFGNVYEKWYRGINGDKRELEEKHNEADCIVGDKVTSIKFRNDSKEKKYVFTIKSEFHPEIKESESRGLKSFWVHICTPKWANTQKTDVEVNLADIEKRIGFYYNGENVDIRLL